MLGRRTSLATAVSLVVGLLAIAAPASAEVLVDWQFDTRPAGFPATNDPALTLVSASALLAQDETGRFDATVELGAVPDESTGTAVRVALGHQVADDCVVDWEQTYPTYDPGGPATRDGATISVHQAIGSTDYEDGCGVVSLVSLADGAELDRLEAPFVTALVSDHAGTARVAQVSNRTVERGRWSTVWLRVGYRGSGPADGVVVTGSGAGVVVRKTVHREALASGDRVWIPVRLRLLASGPRKVTFRATPFGDLFRADADPMSVRIRPTR